MSLASPCHQNSLWHLVNKDVNYDGIHHLSLSHVYRLGNQVNKDTTKITCNDMYMFMDIARGRKVHVHEKKSLVKLLKECM